MFREYPSTSGSDVICAALISQIFSFITLIATFVEYYFCEFFGSSGWLKNRRWKIEDSNFGGNFEFLENTSDNDLLDQSESILRLHLPFTTSFIL